MEKEDFKFMFFKKNDEIHKPFIIFKNKTFAYFCASVVIFTVSFANIFTIIEPALKGDYISTIAMIAGPVIFTIGALVIYYLGEKNK